MSDTKPNQEVVTRDVGVSTPASPLSSAVSAESLIQQGISSGMSVDTLERLLAMRRELRAEAAKEAFDAAMADLQDEMPIINKTSKVFEKGSTTKVRYQFAPIDSIVQQTKEYIAKHGFSYKTDTDTSVSKEMTVTVTVKHRAGHTEKSSMTVPIDSEGYMSAPQKVAAATTFAKRYAFCNAFGIITGDADTDASPDTVADISDRAPGRQQPQRPPQPPAPKKSTITITVNNVVDDYTEKGKEYQRITTNSGGIVIATDWAIGMFNVGDKLRVTGTWGDKNGTRFFMTDEVPQIINQ